ncbi:MAG: type 1 glutamine amidotransferase [Nocardioidaceae bacterium]
MKLLIVQPDPGCTADRYGTWLTEAGAELSTCGPYAGDEVPPQVDGGGLVVLGGHMGAMDDHEFPWLADVRALMRSSADRGVPTLGICLGAQLLAAACGGQVEVGRRGIEAGVVEVRWRDEAAEDALVSALPDPFPGPSMHRDAIAQLPSGAVWLGQTALYPYQAFRVHERAWGVQFHPEVSLPSFTDWRHQVSEEQWDAYGVDGDAVVEQLRERDDEVAAAGEQLAKRFATVAG